MTEKEKIIVSAYTGYLMCDFDKVHQYIEQKLGRPVMMNYEVLANIYKSRKNHKLDEWAETKLTGDCPADMYPNKFTNGFCDWIKTLPYSELITGEENTHA